MTTLPNLPTDSLYKFLFVFGVLLLVYSSYQIHQLELQLNFDQAKADSLVSVGRNAARDYRKISSSIDSLIAKIKAEEKLYKENSDAILESAKTGRVSYKTLISRHKSTKNAYEKSWELSQRRIIELKHQSDSIDKLSANIDNDFIKFSTIGKNTELEGWFVTVLAIIGIVLAFIGSFNWYFKIQMFQDKILKLQYEQLLKETSSKKVVSRQHIEPFSSYKRRY